MFDHIAVLFTENVNARERLSDYVHPNIGIMHSRWFFLYAGGRTLWYGKTWTFNKRQLWQQVGVGGCWVRRQAYLYRGICLFA
jgi:hypothetical protein